MVKCKLNPPYKLKSAMRLPSASIQVKLLYLAKNKTMLSPNKTERDFSELFNSYSRLVIGSVFFSFPDGDNQNHKDVILNLIHKPIPITP